MTDVGKSESVPDSIWNEKSAGNLRAVDYSRPWYRYARRLIEAANIRHNGKAVDVGCGVGEFLEELSNIGFEAKGFDGEPNQVDSLKKRGLDVELVDLEKPLPLDDALYDLACCLEVVEHIVRAESLVKELFRILKGGGHLIISTPNFSCWQNRLRYLKGAPPVNEGVHLRFYNPATFRTMLREAGFDIVQCSSYAPYTGLNYLRRKLAKEKMFWIASGVTESFFAEVLLYLVRKV